MRFSFRNSITILVAVLVLAIPCTASSIRRLSLTQVRDKADRIVVGVVFEKSTRVGASGKMVWTDYKINVVEMLKGEQSGQYVTLSFAGGQSGDLDTGVIGVPVLETGRQYLFFVDDSQLVPTPTIGWGQGLYEFVESKVNGREVTALLSHDGEPLQVTSDGAMVRGARMAVQDGQLMTLSRQGQRLSDPVAFNADGSQAVLVKRAPAVSSKAAPRFASLSDVRLFVRDKMRERQPAAR
jgi:hypothetical protein